MVLYTRVFEYIKHVYQNSFIRIFYCNIQIPVYSNRLKTNIISEKNGEISFKSYVCKIPKVFRVVFGMCLQTGFLKQDKDRHKLTLECCVMHDFVFVCLLFIKENNSGTLSECQTVWIHIRTDVWTFNNNVAAVTNQRYLQ